MTGTIGHEAGGVRWSLRPDLYERRTELFGPTGLRLSEWLAGGVGQVIKDAGRRSVYRVVLPGLDFHVKHFHSLGMASWLRALTRKSKARVEFDNAVTVAALHVPAVEALAVGGDYILTRTVPDAQRLSTFFDAGLPNLAPARQARLRHRLARALGRLLCRMHAAGVSHDRLHPDGILLRVVGDDQPLLCLADLGAVRIGQPLNAAARFTNLVAFSRWFAPRSDRTDRLRFWRAYDSSDGLRDKPGVLGPAHLEGRALEANLRRWRKTDRRCLGDNRSFRRVRSGDISGHAVADLAPDFLAALLADPDEPFRRPGVAVLKRSPSSQVVELEVTAPEGPRRVIFKRFTVTSRSDPWAALFRPTPALRSFVMGHGLRARGLPTPRPLAVLHRRRFGLPREGYLLTEKVPNARDLKRAVTEFAASPTALRALIDRVARMVRTLHERRLSHRDLKAPNLLVGPEPMDVCFIDLVGVRVHRHLGRARRVRNLARLCASFVGHTVLTRTDRLRFLRVYLEWGPHGKTGWKDWWREIDAATQAKIKRNQRSGRVLG